MLHSPGKLPVNSSSSGEQAIGVATPVIEIRQLHKAYGGLEVLKQIHPTNPDIRFLALSVSDAAGLSADSLPVPGFILSE